MIASQVTPRIADAAEARRIAAQLAPSIGARAAETQALRSVAADSIRDLHASGLFALVTPKRFGGSELGMDATLEATIEIAAACGSTGWVYGVLAGHTWLAAKFPVAAQEEVFAQPDVLIASLIRLGGSAPERVPGGYVWRGGTGKFCSGIDHAHWVLVGGVVREPDGSDVQRYFLVPRSDVEIVDDWYTAGLRGTGSKSIVVRDAFIPEHRSVTFAAMLDGSAPGGEIHGAYYRLPFQLVWPLSLPGTAIGTARAALAAYTRMVEAKLGALTEEGVAEQSPSFVRIADAGARIDAAELVLLTNARRLNGLHSVQEVTPAMRARYRRDSAFAVREARQATNALFEASGGSGVYESGPMERIWRDNNVSAAHIGFAWDGAAVAYGRDALGLGGANRNASAVRSRSCCASRAAVPSVFRIVSFDEMTKCSSSRMNVRASCSENTESIARADSSVLPSLATSRSPFGVMNSARRRLSAGSLRRSSIFSPASVVTLVVAVVRSSPRTRPTPTWSTPGHRFTTLRIAACVGVNP